MENIGKIIKKYVSKKQIKIGEIWTAFKKSPSGYCLLALVPEGPAYKLFSAGFKSGWQARTIHINLIKSRLQGIEKRISNIERIAKSKNKKRPK